MPWMLFAIGCGFFWSLGRAMRFSAATTGGLMLVGGLANTSFVGLPMIEAFYGRSGIATGILIDKPSATPRNACDHVTRRSLVPHQM